MSRLGNTLRFKHCAAFTLTEIVVALTLVAIGAATALLSLTTANRQAGASRLFTAAQAFAQNQLELAEYDGPFNPQLTPPQIPLSLEVDTRWKQNVTVYSDPINDNVIVTGTLRTEVSDPGFVFNGTNLNMRQVSVRLFYTYAGRNYTVKMSTLRASDL